jgi:hypothetical protein
VTPTYRGLDAGTRVSWSGGRAAGLELVQSALAPELSDGVFNLPLAEVPASGGIIRLAATVDLRGDEPVLTTPPRLQTLENVELNAIFGRDVLSRFNPVFGELAELSGKASLVVQDIELPLGDRLKTAGRGSGRLDLADVRVKPTGAMAKLVELGGLAGEDGWPVRVSGLDFRIRDGGVDYDNFAMTFGEDFDLVFHGRVNFDDSIDMAVSVPVRAAMFERMGVSGPVREYARMLEGVRVDIPLVGSRLKPQLDMAKVDLKPMVDRAIQKLLSEEAAKAADRLMRRDDKQSDTQPGTQPATKPATRIEELLRDILDKQRKSDGRKR